MPKATITFDLPEEAEEYRMHVSAAKYLAALEDLAETFRTQRKYDGPVVTEKRFWELLNENGVALWE